MIEISNEEISEKKCVYEKDGKTYELYTNILHQRIVDCKKKIIEEI